MATKVARYPQELLSLITAMPLEATLTLAEDGGFFIFSEEVPGCFAAGSTIPETFKNFKVALFDYYEVPQTYRKPDALRFSSTDIPDSLSFKKPEHFSTEIDKRLVFA